MTQNVNSNFATAPLPNVSGAQNVPFTKTAPLGADFSDTPLPTIKVSKPIKIPAGVSSNAKQHVVLVRDNSSSMGGHKIDELNLACTGLLQELSHPENKDGFLVSVIEFSTGSSRELFAESAVTLNLPIAVASGGTNFDSAALETISTIEDFKSQPNADGWKFLRSQVIFLSDGQSRISDKNVMELHEIANVTTIAYGSDADVSTLSRIASDGQVHIVGTDGGELRKFLAEVGKTLSQDLASA